MEMEVNMEAQGRSTRVEDGKSMRKWLRLERFGEVGLD